MREVVLYQLLSLDGVAGEPSDWVFETDDVLLSHLTEVISTQDTVLLGRGTYEYWVDHWPTADMQPFADFVNGTPKHVLTSTPLSKPWTGATAVHAPAEQHVAALRAGDGGDIGIHGSTTLARSLLRAGLVDQLQLVVAPTIARQGARLFDADGDLQRLELQAATPTPSGLLLLSYRVPR